MAEIAAEAQRVRQELLGLLPWGNVQVEFLWGNRDRNYRKIEADDRQYLYVLTHRRAIAISPMLAAALERRGWGGGYRKSIRTAMRLLQSLEKTP